MHNMLNINGSDPNFNIMGRAVVLHLFRDDLGRGPVESDTLLNGNSGTKIACGNIGFTGPPDADEQNPWVVLSTCTIELLRLNDY